MGKGQSMGMTIAIQNATELHEDVGMLKPTDDILLTHARSSAIMTAVALDRPDLLTVRSFLHGWTDLKVGEMIGRLTTKRNRFNLETYRIVQATGSTIQIQQVASQPEVKHAKGDILWRAADFDSCFGPWSLAERTADDGQFIDIVLPYHQRIPRRLELMVLNYKTPPQIDHLPFEHQSFVMWSEKIVRPLRCKGRVIALYLADHGCRARVDLGHAA